MVTGSEGFIGKNLCTHLSRVPDTEVLKFNRNSSDEDLTQMVNDADWIIHLAGVNRPLKETEFEEVNIGLSHKICQVIENTGRKVPIIFASSKQAEQDNPYGKSKLEAEKCFLQLSETTGNPVQILRLPNVFGKWCKPNYNSVVATFCHNIANGLEISIHDPLATIELLYVDDLIAELFNLINMSKWEKVYIDLSNTYRLTVGGLASQIKSFSRIRETSMAENVGIGVMRALYSTYLSYVPKKDFCYDLKVNFDQRGSFVEVLKTKQSGQFSYFTAKPGITRGGHYHHSKTEKFLILKGSALFRFHNIDNDDYHEITVNGGEAKIIDTIPGWSHDVTNIGDDELICMLWANEVFDHLNPDTFNSPMPNCFEGEK